MTKPTIKTIVKPSAIDYTKLPYGVYLNDVKFGKINYMRHQRSMWGDDEFVFEGKLHHGEIKFIGGDVDKLDVVFPIVDGYNHGYMLHGEARNCIKAENALVVNNDYEGHTYCYSNKNTKLYFTGDEDKVYKLYIRIFDNIKGIPNHRWVVVWGEF